jgi:mRNA interferase RelE/StbE
MYELDYTEQVRKKIKKLPKKTQKHILAVLERARIRPEKHFDRLVGLKSYKLRAVNYRIIADIFRDKLVILVIDVGHRGSIYK